MKKTINDLKLNDKVYYLTDDKATEISTTSIDMISNDEIKTKYGHKGKLDKSDFTSWQFIANYSHNVTFYLNREDLLQKILSNANKKLESTKNAQSQIILKLLDHQKLVIEIESEIKNLKP